MKRYTELFEREESNSALIFREQTCLQEMESIFQNFVQHNLHKKKLETNWHQFHVPRDRTIYFS